MGGQRLRALVRANATIQCSARKLSTISEKVDTTQLSRHVISQLSNPNTVERDNFLAKAASVLQERDLKCLAKQDFIRVVDSYSKCSKLSRQELLPLFSAFRNTALLRWGELKTFQTVELLILFSRCTYYAAELFDRVAMINKDQLADLRPNQVAGLAYAFALHQRNDVQIFRSTFETAMSPESRRWRTRDLSILLYSMAMVECMPDSVVAYLRDKLQRHPEDGFSRIDLYQLYQADLTAMALRGNGKIDSWDPVILDSKAFGRIRASVAAQKHKPSGKEQQLQAVLHEMGYATTAQAKTEVGYSIDMVLEGGKTGMEYNGPLHYAIDLGADHYLKPPRELGRSVIKHRHLRSIGWNVIIVPHFEWDPLYDLGARKRYLEKILVDESG